MKINNNNNFLVVTRNIIREFPVLLFGNFSFGNRDFMFLCVSLSNFDKFRNALFTGEISILYLKCY